MAGGEVLAAGGGGDGGVFNTRPRKEVPLKPASGSHHGMEPATGRRAGERANCEEWDCADVHSKMGHPLRLASEPITE